MVSSQSRRTLPGRRWTTSRHRSARDRRGFAEARRGTAIFTIPVLVLSLGCRRRHSPRAPLPTRVTTTGYTTSWMIQAVTLAAPPERASPRVVVPADHHRALRHVAARTRCALTAFDHRAAPPATSTEHALSDRRTVSRATRTRPRARCCTSRISAATEPRVVGHWRPGGSGRAVSS